MRDRNCIAAIAIKRDVPNFIEVHRVARCVNRIADGIGFAYDHRIISLRTVGGRSRAIVR
jgi:hypothetical protein